MKIQSTENVRLGGCVRMRRMSDNMTICYTLVLGAKFSKPKHTHDKVLGKEKNCIEIL